MESQQLITIGIAIVAALYLVRRSIQSLRLKGEGCGSCSGCPENPGEKIHDRSPARKQLYSIEQSSDQAKSA